MNILHNILQQHRQCLIHLFILHSYALLNAHPTRIKKLNAWLGEAVLRYYMPVFRYASTGAVTSLNGFGLARALPQCIT